MVVQRPSHQQGWGEGGGCQGGGQGGHAVPPKMQGWDLLRSFCDHSSLPGLKYLAERRRPWPERLVWLAGLALALAVCSALVLQTWTRWRHSTVILQHSVSDLPFPAVTLCPDVKIDADRLGLYDLLERHHKRNTSREESDIIEDLALVCPLAGFSINYHSNLNDTRPSSAVENIEKYALPLRHYVMSSYLYLNHRDLDEMFKPIITEEGLCYSFNMLSGKKLFANDTFHASRNYLEGGRRGRWQWWPGATRRTDAEGNPQPLRTVGVGRNSAFYLQLSDLPRDQLNPCGNSNGLQVLVHGPGEMPRPSQHALHVPRGSAADVAVSPGATWTDARVRDAYSPRERQCFFPEERALRFFRVYSQGNCELECLANFTLRLCGCVDFYMPRTTNTSLCTFFPGSLCMEYASWRMQQAQTGLWTKPDPGLRSLTRAITQEEERAMQCDCLQECDHVEYKAQLSYRPALPEKRQNVARFPAMLTVFIENSYYNPMRRIELFGTIDFIANCGGLLGLCLGFSVLSIVEVLYWLLVRPLCQRRCSRRSRARCADADAPAHEGFGVFALPQR